MLQRHELRFLRTTDLCASFSIFLYYSPASVSAISLRHILASPGYAPETIAVNVIWMKKKEDSMLVKRIAACTHLQPFPSNSTRKFKSSHFSTFLHILASLWYASGELR